MKTISLYQPYATLVVLGEKINETRSWDTKYRGELLIHATKNFPKWCRELCETEPFKSVLAKHGFTADSLPTGAIVGKAHLYGTMESEEWLQEVDHYGTEEDKEWTDNEKAFGDYSDGRYAWMLDQPERFAEPIPAKGAQGFWNYNGPLT